MGHACSTTQCPVPCDGWHRSGAATCPWEYWVNLKQETERKNSSREHVQFVERALWGWGKENMPCPPTSFVYPCDSMILRCYGPGVPTLGQNQSVRGWNTGKTAAGISSQTPSLKCGLVWLGGKIQVVGTGYILHCLLCICLFIFI